MNLQNEIRELSKQLEEFNDAIALLENPVKYPPQDLAPLKILEADLQQAKDEKERTDKLKYYKDIAAKSEAKLKELVAEKTAKEQQLAEMIKVLQLKGEKIAKASEALKKELQGFEGDYLRQMKGLIAETTGGGNVNPLMVFGNCFLPVVTNSGLGLKIEVEKINI